MPPPRVWDVVKDIIMMRQQLVQMLPILSRQAPRGLVFRKVRLSQVTRGRRRRRKPV